MQVDLLQQILFYRELGLPLEEIREIIKNPGFDREKDSGGPSYSPSAEKKTDRDSHIKCKEDSGFYERKSDDE